MQPSFLSRLRLGAACVAAVAVAGCSNADRSVGPSPEQQPASAPGAVIALELSQANATVGSRIAVGIKATVPGATLGALQGVLHYDATRLHYLGQPLDAATATIVNDAQAGQGMLRLGSLNGRGLAPRTAVLVFEVAGADYAKSLNYEFQVAGTAGSRLIPISRASVVPAAAVADLQVPAEYRTLGRADWDRALAPEKVGLRPQFFAGDLGRVDLRFGNTDLSTEAGAASVTLLDALDVVNVAVGNVFAIQGTGGNLGDAGRKDLVVAANVFPDNNGPTATGTVAPNCRPGLNTCGNAESGVIDLLDALAIVNRALNNPSTVAGNVIPGRGAIPSGLAVVTIPAASCPLTGGRTFSRDTLYVFGKPANPTSVCFLQSGTYTFQDGVRVEADSQTIVVDRDARILAQGTFLRPIEFTCRNPTATAVNGGPFAAGCWGGLYINGNAPVNNGGACPAGGRNNAGLCATGEGGTGTYGGGDPSDSSGVLTYVRILNAGTRFSATNERNGLTLQGVGRGTKIDYVNIDNGLDDGVEFFGGTVNVSHLLVTRSQDDGFDWVGGYRGSAQFVVIRGCTSGCDRGIEADNFGIDGSNTDPEAAPRSAPTLYNFTIVGMPAAEIAASTVSAGVILRQNTAGTLRNFLVFNYKSGLDIDQPANSGTTTGTVYSQQICDVIAKDSLTFRNALVSGNVANGDADANDPVLGNDGAATPAGVCGPYTLNGTFTGGTAQGSASTASNLEAQWLAWTGGARNYATLAGLPQDASTGSGTPAKSAQTYSVTGTVTYPSNAIATPAGGAEAFLRAPFDANPNYSPVGAAATTTGAVPPVNDAFGFAFFDNTATYLGATNPSSALPWWSGWTYPTGR